MNITEEMVIGLHRMTSGIKASVPIWTALFVRRPPALLACIARALMLYTQLPYLVDEVHMTD